MITSFCAASCEAGIAASSAARLGDRLLQLGERHRLVDQAGLHRLGPAQRLAGEPVPLDPGQPEPVDPHPRQVGAPHARVGGADSRVLGGDDDVGAEGEVAAAADAPAVHLGDHRLRRPPDAHELVMGRGLGSGGGREVLARIPLAVGLERAPFESAAEVIAGAERAARAADHDHLHLRVEHGLLDRGLDLLGHRQHDRVQPLGAVERDRRHRGVDAVEDRFVGHGA